MNTKQKKALYESIMKNVAKTVKEQLNEGFMPLGGKSKLTAKQIKKCIEKWFNTAIHTGNDELDNKLKLFILQFTNEFYEQPDEIYNNKSLTVEQKINRLMPYFDACSTSEKQYILETAHRNQEFQKLITQGKIDSFVDFLAEESKKLANQQTNEIDFIDSIITSNEFKHVTDLDSIKKLGEFLKQQKKEKNIKEYSKLLILIVDKILNIMNTK